MAWVVTFVELITFCNWTTQVNSISLYFKNKIILNRVMTDHCITNRSAQGLSKRRLKPKTVTAGYGSEPKTWEFFRTETVDFWIVVRFRFKNFRTEIVSELPVPNRNREKPPENREIKPELQKTGGSEPYKTAEKPPVRNRNRNRRFWNRNRKRETPLRFDSGSIISKTGTTSSWTMGTSIYEYN